MISKTYENILYMESFFFVIDYNVEKNKNITFNKNFKRLNSKMYGSNIHILIIM